MHGMTEQQPNHPRFDVRVGGFGEQQDAAWFEHAAEFGERAVLLDEMVEGLMTEHDVGAGIGKRQLRAVAVQHVDIGELVVARAGRIRGKRK